MVPNKEKKEKKPDLVCPTCGSTEFYEDRTRGELICKRCGTVIEEKPPELPEWAERESAGPPIGPTKRGTTTEIGGLSRLSQKERRKYMRLRVIDRWLTRSRDKTMMTALGELQRQAAYLSLPMGVQEESAALFNKMLAAGMVKGWSAEELITGVLFAVARKHGYPRTTDEFVAASGLKERDIRKAYRQVSRALGLKIAPAKAEDYVPRFGTLLGLSSRAQARARELIGKIPADVMSAKSPVGFAAAAIHIAAIFSGERRKLKDISEAVGIAEFTIRERYKEIVESLGLQEELIRAKK